MKRFLAFVMFLAALAVSMPANAAVCGSGVTCFDSILVLNNANASVPMVPLIAYTAPAGGNGVKVTGILGYGTATNADCVSIFVVHSGTNYPISSACFNAATFFVSNLLVNAGGVSAFPNLSTDENGNPYLLISAGDSLAFAATNGIPSSGVTSGVYTMHVMGQSY